MVIPVNNEAPIGAAMINDKAICTPAWAEYYSNIDYGDAGTLWTPTFTNLATVGTPTISGIYFVNGGFIDFVITIVPGTSTSSTLGTTTFSLPFAFSYDAGCFIVTTTTVALGALNAATKTGYPASWSAITTKITITGRVKAQ